MESLIEYTNRIAKENWLWSRTGEPEIAEPITKPEIKPDTRPAQDDPFNVPAPKVDPTPKGFIFFSNSSL